MDHVYIEEHQVVDRYLMGKLTAEELGGFEEHYLSCTECLDRLETTADLARALKRVGGEEAARVAAARQLAVVAWLARLGRSRQAAVLLSGLLLLLLVPGLAIFRAGELRRELRDSRSAMAATAAAAAAAAAGSRDRAELAASRGDLARERAASARAAQELSRAREPQANVPILYLGAERGAGRGGEPAYRLRLPARAEWVVIALPLDPPRHAAYRIVLSRAAGGAEIWRSDAITADQDTLTLSVPKRLLAPGDHVLTVSGIAPGGASVAVGRFLFRVVAAN
jgi:hypothetical protein